VTGIARRAAPLALLLLAATGSAPAAAQFMTGKRVDKERASAAAAQSNRRLVEQVGFDQQLGSQLPLDLGFRDESGSAVRLGDYFGDKPVVLAFVYYRCPVLCSLVERGVASGLKPLDLDPGDDFEVVFVSIDPTDDAATATERRDAVLASYGRPGSDAGWHFLTGGQEAITAVTAAAGFRYAPDPATGQFAHAAGIAVVTPGGRISRYLFGVDYAPRDLKLALVESSDGTIGSPADKLLLVCFRYDATLGKYTVATLLALKIGATLTLAAIGTFLFFALRRDRRQRRERQLHAGGVA